jgi:hypothetical protein
MSGTFASSASQEHRDTFIEMPKLRSPMGMIHRLLYGRGKAPFKLHEAICLASGGLLMGQVKMTKHRVIQSEGVAISWSTQ